MKTSLIIPFRNEKDCAELAIRSLHGCFSNAGILFELIAVDDSSDGTWEILQALKSTYSNLTVVRGGGNPGYGRALRKGFEVASGDIVIPFNGDLSDNPKDAVKYVELIGRGFDLVLGSRFLNPDYTPGSLLKNLVSRAGNNLMMWMYRSDCNDITNSFKAYRKHVIDSVEPTSNGYEISLEITLTAIKRGFRYTCIPIDWKEREFGHSKMSILRNIHRCLFIAIRIRIFA